MIEQTRLKFEITWVVIMSRMTKEFFGKLQKLQKLTENRYQYDQGGSDLDFGENYYSRINYSWKTKRPLTVSPNELR